MDEEIHWRYSARGLRLLGMSAWAFAPLPLTLLRLKPGTLIGALSVVLVFWLLERRGYSVQVCLRVLRLRVGGLMKWPIVIDRPRRYSTMFDYY